MTKPYSQSCENNKRPILQVIQTVFVESATVWEIGSGTGQHACYFAQKLPHLTWQPTDREENLAGINSWVKETSLSNIADSKVLDVTNDHWPCQQIDALFTANTLHIMSWNAVESLFAGLNNYLSSSASVCIYGPFNYNGEYTSDSNEQFDQWLKMRDPLSGIRDFESVKRLAHEINLYIRDDVTMPANNRLLVFKRNQ